MIGWLASLRGRISSPWLAGAFAAAYLFVSILLGVALLTAPPDPSGDATPMASTPRYEIEPAPSESDEPAPSPAEQPRSGDLSSTEATITGTPPRPTAPPDPAPTGFRQVTGPAGLRTVVPSEWRSMPSTGPGAEQAIDPANATRYVKYGGSAAPPMGIESSHVRYETGFAARTDGYRRISLSSANYDGHAAVEWEFEHREGADVKHVRSLYWRSDGKEYFLLAAAPATQWDEMKPIYDTMVANAEP